MKAGFPNSAKNKAKRARSLGTKVIDETEMIAFIKAGKFPVRSLN